MSKFLNVLAFVTICVPFTWTLYVPEYTSNDINLHIGDDVLENQAFSENKTFRPDLQQSIKNKFDNNVKNDNHEQLQAKTNVHQVLPIRRQQKSYDIDYDVAVGTKNRTIIHENLEAQPTGLAKQPEIHKKKDVLIEIAEKNDQRNTLQHARYRRQLSDFWIAPNTRWCGRGNTANGTYNHLGGASMADKCCRTHDHCKLYIPAMSNRFELFNYRPYTLSHCYCDRRFRTCLKITNDEDADTIGKLFFNLVQTQCFLLSKEVTCQERANNGTCLKEHIKQKAYLRNNKKY